MQSGLLQAWPRLQGGVPGGTCLPELCCEHWHVLQQHVLTAHSCWIKRSRLLYGIKLLSHVGALQAHDGTIACMNTRFARAKARKSFCSNAGQTALPNNALPHTDAAGRWSVHRSLLRVSEAYSCTGGVHRICHACVAQHQRRVPGGRVRFRHLREIRERLSLGLSYLHASTTLCLPGFSCRRTFNVRRCNSIASPHSLQSSTQAP